MTRIRVVIPVPRDQYLNVYENVRKLECKGGDRNDPAGWGNICGS
jgi:hypothetical protein